MTVVIDLSRVTFMDSTGIGLMVRFKKNLKRRDITLKFINAIASVRNVVRQTQLGRVSAEIVFCCLPACWRFVQGIRMTVGKPQAIDAEGRIKSMSRK